VKQAAGAIERSMQRQVRLVEDLLDVSRIVTGGLRLDRRPVDLVAVVVAAADHMRPLAQEKGVALGTTMAPVTARVLGDPQRLEQVVVNLLQNAIEYTSVGGRVDVELDGDPRGARIRVTDTGEGIPADLLPHVFERFRQADSTYTRRQGGLGLGLAIVRHLVELHGGTVAAESAGAGHGATFRVRLPLRMAEAEALREIAERSSDLPAPRLTGVAVLVVDDDADTRAALGAALEERGAAVTLAESAAEALAAIDAATPDVLLCDVAMPGENGFELIRTLRARDPARGGSIPAAALTAYASEEDERLALEAGFHRHLAKPVDPLDLAAAVAELAATTEPSAAPRRAHGQSA
jgi:CheY-like chemotaxis protein